jgi:tetratricopeptide (TPR) repeat protein
VTPLRFTLALVLAALAALSALAGADVRSARSALAGGDAVYAASPSRASWTAPAHLGGMAEALLGTHDDVQLREALQQYVDAASLHLRLDNAVDVESARARAQDALERLSRDHDPRRASQALTLLGILAFEASAADGSQSQVDAAISDFTDAVRDDPTNEQAAYDLELLLRLAAAHGSRVQPGPGDGFGTTGRRGAGGGQPGSGY